MIVENSAKRQGEIVQVGVNESMVKVRYSDGSESFESIDSLVLSDAVVTGSVPDDFLADDNSDIIRGYRY